jgi:flagellar hook-associated protein 1 FlgK
MSLYATLNNALSGLSVAQRGLSVTANNVANANTPGYTRKILAQEAVVLAGRGSGVAASEITRIADRFLIEEMRRQSSVIGQSDALRRYHDLLQTMLGAPGDDLDLASQTGALSAALEAYANSPETSALALQVVSLAEDLSSSIGRLADQVQTLRGDADREIGQVVAGFDGELTAIHQINVEIERLAYTGQTSPELLDRRDLLIKSLAEKIDIHTFVQENGRVAIYTAGGEALLDTEPRVVTYDPASSVAHGTSFGAIAIFRQDQIDPATGQPFDPAAGVELVSAGVRAPLTPELQNDAVPDADQLIVSGLRGGRLQGLLEMRDRVLPGLDDQIQELAAGLRFALNAAHNAGVAWPPPSALTGTRTDLADFAGAVRSGTATIAVIDRADGSTLASFEVDLGAAADETALAAQIDAGLGGLGSAAIGPDGNLSITLADPDQGLAIAEDDGAITVTDAAGRDRTYGLSHYFGLNDLFVLERSRASTLRVRPEIVAEPSLLSAARLDVAGMPPVATLGGRGDNRGAQALADALRTSHDFIARGGLPAKPATLAGYAADIIAHSAARAARAEETDQREHTLMDALEFRFGAVSGVNLDEEMARMIQLQQAYSVAARIIMVTDELFDELLGTVG